MRIFSYCLRMLFKGVSDMKEEFTHGGLYAISNVLEAELMAGKKARLYANTLTDMQIAERMQSLADSHAARFSSLLELFAD